MDHLYDLVNNRHFLRFNNGVYCLGCDKFWPKGEGLGSDPHCLPYREGLSPNSLSYEDYDRGIGLYKDQKPIELSVGYDYEPQVNPSDREAIEAFMAQLWPEPEAIWDWLVSCLSRPKHNVHIQALLSSEASCDKILFCRVLEGIFGTYVRYGPPNFMNWRNSIRCDYRSLNPSLDEAQLDPYRGARLVIIKDHETVLSPGSYMKEFMGLGDPIALPRLYCYGRIPYEPLFNVLAITRRPFLLRDNDSWVRRHLRYQTQLETDSPAFMAKGDNWRMAFMAMLLDRARSES